jgi:hypothetical protein
MEILKARCIPKRKKEMILRKERRMKQTSKWEKLIIKRNSKI